MKQIRIVVAILLAALIALVIVILQRPSQEVRDLLALDDEALIKRLKEYYLLNEPRPLSFYAPLIRHDNPRVRKAAYSAGIWWLMTEESSLWLSQALSDPDESVRNAVHSMAFLPTPITPKIVERVRLEARKQDCEAWAIEALCEKGVDAFIDYLASLPPEERNLDLQLRRYRDPQLSPLLCETLRAIDSPPAQLYAETEANTEILTEELLHLFLKSPRQPLLGLTHEAGLRSMPVLLAALREPETPSLKALVTFLATRYPGHPDILGCVLALVKQAPKSWHIQLLTQACHPKARRALKALAVHANAELASQAKDGLMFRPEFSRTSFDCLVSPCHDGLKKPVVERSEAEEVEVATQQFDPPDWSSLREFRNSTHRLAIAKALRGLPAFRSQPAWTRWQMLGQLGHPDAFDYHLAVVEHAALLPSSDIGPLGAESIDCLAKINDPRAREVILQAFIDSIRFRGYVIESGRSPAGCGNFFRAFAKFQEPRARPYMLKAIELYDSDGLRLSYAKYLVATRQIAPMVELLQHPETPDDIADHIVKDLADAFLVPLLADLEHPNYYRRFRAIRFTATLPDPRVERTIQEFRESDDPAQQLAAHYALTRRDP
ncbi:MAG: hypothetical protein ACI8W8_001906 [Rhodothermales bacterium]|jgi:HEAT repeat protein